MRDIVVFEKDRGGERGGGHDRKGGSFCLSVLWVLLLLYGFGFGFSREGFSV